MHNPIGQGVIQHNCRITSLTDGFYGSPLEKFLPDCLIFILLSLPPRFPSRTAVHILPLPPAKSARFASRSPPSSLPHIPERSSVNRHLRRTHVGCELCRHRHHIQHCQRPSMTFCLICGNFRRFQGSFRIIGSQQNPLKNRCFSFSIDKQLDEDSRPDHHVGIIFSPFAPSYGTLQHTVGTLRHTIPCPEPVRSFPHTPCTLPRRHRTFSHEVVNRST